MNDNDTVTTNLGEAIKTNEYTELDYASNIVENSMRQYAAYTLSEQLPNPVDGLKLVHRRILWMIRDAASKIKMHTLIGRVVTLHPHSDDAIENAIVRLGQEFSLPMPLVEVIGNIGSYSGDTPAAGRYLDVLRSEFAHDVYFKNTDVRILDYVKSEMGEGYEPVHLIPKIPMALLTCTFGIAIGFRTDTPPFEYRSICNIAQAMFDNPMENVRSILMKNPEWLIPDSLVPSIIRNHKEIMDNVRKGNFNFPIVYDGNITVGSKSIRINTLPLGAYPANLGEKCWFAIRDKNDPLFKYVQRTSDESQDNLDLVFILKRGVDPFDALRFIKKKVTFSKRFTMFLRYVSDDGKLLECDIADILENWFTARRRAALSALKHRQTSLVKEIRQCEAKQVIIGHLDEFISIVRNAVSDRDAVAKIMQQYKLTMNQSEYLVSLPIRTLQREGVESLKKQLDIAREALHNMRNDFATIDKNIASSISTLRDRYKRDRQAAIPRYTGVLKTERGYVQFWNKTELHELLLEFGAENSNVQLYSKGRRWKYSLLDGKTEGEDNLDLPKEDRSDKLMVVAKKPKYTIARYGNLLKRFDEIDLKIIKTADDISLVGDDISVITSDGYFQVRKATSIPVHRRMKIEEGGIDGISELVSDKLILIHGNPREKNIIRMSMVSSGDKVSKLSIGKWQLLGAYECDEEFIVNIPAELLNRTRIYHFAVNNANAIMKDNSTIRINVSNRKASNGAKLKKDAHGMYVLCPE